MPLTRSLTLSFVKSGAEKKRKKDVSDLPMWYRGPFDQSLRRIDTWNLSANQNGWDGWDERFNEHSGADSDGECE